MPDPPDGPLKSEILNSGRTRRRETARFVPGFTVAILERGADKALLDLLSAAENPNGVSYISPATVLDCQREFMEF